MDTCQSCDRDTGRKERCKKGSMNEKMACIGDLCSLESKTIAVFELISDDKRVWPCNNE